MRLNKGAFSGCSDLTSVIIPDSVTSIGDYAFSGCSGVASIIVEEANTMYCSENNCLIEKSTKKLILGCKNSIIPDGVTSIGDKAFYSCNGLTSITIPDSVTSIGGYAFYGCSGLTSVNYNGTKEQWAKISKIYSWKNESSIKQIICTDGTIYA